MTLGFLGVWTHWLPLDPCSLGFFQASVCPSVKWGALPQVAILLDADREGDVVSTVQMSKTLHPRTTSSLVWEAGDLNPLQAHTARLREEC